MSTHILSDIEALCDEVAILRMGKLAAAGNLSDLLTDTGESRSFEVNVEGVSAEKIRDDVEFIAGAAITSRPNGASIHILDEADIEAVLKITREKGGRLASVQPVKQSLEELFVREAVSEPTA